MKSVRSLSLWIFALIVVQASIGSSLHAQPQRTVGRSRQQASFQAPPNAPKYATDRILVRFRPGTPKPRAQAAHAAVQAQVVRSFKAVRDLDVVRLPEKMTVSAALDAYRKDPAVLYAEPDYVVHALQNPVTPNDPRFSELWGLHNMGQTGGTPGADIHAPQAWSLSTGSPNVVVGVIDTGIDYNHEDLNANMFRNPLDCNSNGVDDDGNGFIDDCYGIDTVNGDSDPMDDAGHGTHVAGTIGAVGNNGVGVVGVNWQVKLLACKFLTSEGWGYTSGAVACLDYMAAMKDRGVNIVAINNSWGGGDFSQALLDAIDVQRQKGILFVAAAGNDSSDNEVFPHYPSSYFLPNILAVAATDSADLLADFSNFGRYSVHLGAPGVNILSTVPGALWGNPPYDSFSGTSMATPHVTGVAALLAAQDPTRDWKAIKNLILAGGDTIPALADTISQKRLNAYGAMTCTNSTILSRLQPRTTVVTLTEVGLPVELTVLHINCATPNGDVSVSVDGGAETVPLLDNGQGTDQEADDGIYSAQWTPTAAGIHTLEFPGGDVVTVQILRPYQFSTDVGFNYRNIEGTNLDLSDDDSVSVTSPFPIQFGGGSFGSLYVNSNGNITFSQASVASYNQPIPAAPDFVPLRAAPFWDDLYPPNGAGVYWDVIGSAPNRELVIEWRDVPHYDCLDSFGSTVKFQAVFFEGSSDILFNYADAAFGPPCELDDYGASATVGVQVAPQMGTQFSFNAPSLADGAAILWTTGPVPGPFVSLAPASVNFSPQPVNTTSPPRSVVLTNSGSADLVISEITVNNSYVFAQTNDCPATLTPAASCTFDLTFTPSGALRYVGSLSITDNAAGSPQEVRLDGTGVADQFTLTVNRSGSGSGTVTSNPAGIDCGATCSAPFNSGTTVSLTATPASGSTFTGWSGDCSGTGLCSVIVNAAKNVAAAFELPFHFGPAPPAQTKSAGQSAQFPLEVDGSSGFTGSVSFSCTSGVPPAAACSFNPASVSPGSGTATATLTVTTTARTTAALQPSPGVVFAFLLMPLGLILGAGARRSRQWMRLACLGIVLAVVGTIVACGGGSGGGPPPPNLGTPPGTYTITVTGTSSNPSSTQPIAVTLTVN